MSLPTRLTEPEQVREFVAAYPIDARTEAMKYKHNCTAHTTME